MVISLNFKVPQVICYYKLYTLKKVMNNILVDEQVQIIVAVTSVLYIINKDENNE